MTFKNKLKKIAVMLAVCISAQVVDNKGAVLLPSKAAESVSDVYIQGDINKDGNVDNQDIEALKNQNYENSLYADFNGDGAVDSEDSEILSLNISGEQNFKKTEILDFDNFIEKQFEIINFAEAEIILESESESESENYNSGRLIVKTDFPEILMNTNPIDYAFCENGINILQFESSEKAEFEANRLSEISLIKWAEPDVYIKIEETNSLQAENAPKPESAEPLSWGVKRIGADVYAEYLETQNLDTQVVVAVLDTGVDADHPFLSGRVLPGLNLDELDIEPYDGNGHGTHVSGTIVDCTPNLPVNILPVKVLDNDGYGYMSVINTGIVWAVDNGANVINMSLGGEISSEHHDEVIDYALSQNVTVVVAAGNECTDTIRYCPSHLQNEVIVVAAFGEDDQPAYFTNYGESVDLAAPGIDIFSSVPGGYYEYYQGTSMAAPHIAGAAALILLSEPGLSPAKVEAALIDVSRFNNFYEKTSDFPYGWGIPDLSMRIEGDFVSRAITLFSFSYEESENNYIFKGTGRNVASWEIHWLIDGYSPGVVTEIQNSSDIYAVAPKNLDYTGAILYAYDEENGRGESTYKTIDFSGCAIDYDDTFELSIDSFSVSAIKDGKVEFYASGQNIGSWKIVWLSGMDEVEEVARVKNGSDVYAVADVLPDYTGAILYAYEEENGTGKSEYRIIDLTSYPFINSIFMTSEKVTIDDVLVSSTLKIRAGASGFESWKIAWLKGPDHEEVGDAIGIQNKCNIFLYLPVTDVYTGIKVYVYSEENGQGEVDVFVDDDTNNSIMFPTEPAIIQPKENFTVEFYTDSGSNVPSQTIKWGEKAFKPKAPTKEGYTFKEWQKDGEKFDFSTPITENILLVAVWEENPKKDVMITFDSKGGTEINSIIIESGETISAPITPIKSGYTFEEWQLDGMTFDFDTPITEDIILEAVWKINTHTVTFIDYDGTILKNEVVNYGEFATAPNNPIREGYNFIGWNVAFDNVIDDLIVTAQYSLQIQGRYTVVFQDSNGTTLYAQEVIEDEKVINPTVPTKSGYTFEEWQQDGMTFDFDTPITENITLKAVWKINTHTVIFIDYDGVILKNEVVNYGGFAIAPNNPTREGYNFIGWDVAFDNVIDDLIVTAQYSLQTQGRYTVVFQDSNGTTLYTQEVIEGEKVINPTAPTKLGYTFEEWQLDGMTFDFDTSITENITLEAVWKINTHTVIFIDYDGVILKNEVVNYGEFATAPNNPIREGYNFIGWDVAFDNVIDDLIVTAQYSLQTQGRYTVVFQDSNGTTLYTQEVIEGEKVINPTVPTKSGYTFEEWQQDGMTFDFDTPITENIILKAVWKINTHIVTFIDYDGTILKIDIVNYGGFAIAPNNPTREGYNFIGWDVAFDNVIDDLIVIAQYVLKTPIFNIKDYLDNRNMNVVYEDFEQGVIPRNDYIRLTGDVNCDSVFDLNDIVTAKKMFLSFTGYDSKDFINMTDGTNYGGLSDIVILKKMFLQMLPANRIQK